MRRLAAGMALTAALIGPASLAHAGVYSDDLSKCLVRSTTEQDQTAFMVWMFSALSVHPAVRPSTTISDAQRAAASKKAAALMQRLMIEDCHKESVAALKYEGGSAIEQAFNIFGQAAMRGLITEPSVAQSMAEPGQYVDNAKFEALRKEAGVN